jgi:ribonuclease HI
VNTAEAIVRLERRLEYLRKRIARCGDERASYDRAEVAALAIALEALEREWGAEQLERQRQNVVQGIEVTA